MKLNIVFALFVLTTTALAQVSPSTSPTSPGRQNAIKGNTSTSTAATAATSSGPPDERSTRVAEIQTALQKEGLDGWLFYDFRGSDILTPRILKTERLGGSRRWFYFIPATGEPVKVVHAIEPGQIDVLPGKKLIYREWSLLRSQVKTAMGPRKGMRIAMQYSP